MIGIFVTYCLFGGMGVFGYMLGYAIGEKVWHALLPMNKPPQLPHYPNIQATQYRMATGVTIIEICYNGQTWELSPLQHSLLLLVDSYGQYGRGLTYSDALRGIGTTDASGVMITLEEFTHMGILWRDERGGYWYHPQVQWVVEYDLSHR